MQAIRRSRFVRFVVPFTCGSLLAGCTHWATVESPWVASIYWHQPDTVRVTLPDQSKLVVISPTVEGDSLLGLVKTRSNTAVQRPDGVWVMPDDSASMVPLVAVSEIQKVEWQKLTLVGQLLPSLGTAAMLGFVGTSARLTFWNH